MFCSKCGASVVGKFCSCCGQRVRSEIEEFRLTEQRARRAFLSECSELNGPAWWRHLADACWLTASVKYRKDPRFEGVSYAQALDNLEEIKFAARGLFNELRDF